MNEQRLAEALRAAGTFRDGELVYFDSGTPRRSYRTIESAISALDAAGLLVTDLHKRALEACERMYEAEHGPNDGPMPRGWTSAERKSHREAACIGAESLAAKQPPKPRWKVHYRPEGSTRHWAVTEDGPVCYTATFDSEADAREFADKKNREVE